MRRPVSSLKPGTRPALTPALTRRTPGPWQRLTKRVGVGSVCACPDRFYAGAAGFLLVAHMLDHRLGLMLPVLLLTVRPPHKHFMQIKSICAACRPAAPCPGSRLPGGGGTAQPQAKCTAVL